MSCKIYLNLKWYVSKIKKIFDNMP